jgi:hypothetical protein
MRNFLRLGPIAAGVVALLCLVPGERARADDISFTSSPFTGGTLSLPTTFNSTAALTDGGSLAGTFTGNPTFSGNPLFNGGLTTTTINGVTQDYALSYSSAASPANGGTNYVVGDYVTLNCGGPTNPVVAVQSLSGSAVTAYSIIIPGACLFPPSGAGALVQSATTGNGTGLTITPTWGSIAAYVAGTVLNPGQGNFSLTGQGFTNGVSPFTSQLTGTENELLQIRSNNNIGGSSSFNTFLSLNAAGGAYNAGTWVGSSNFVGGVDCLRNAGGFSGVTAVGVGCDESLTSAGVQGDSMFGNSVFQYNANGAGDRNSQGFGKQACAGNPAGSNWKHGQCFGNFNGQALDTFGSQDFFIFGNYAGNLVAPGVDFALFAAQTPVDVQSVHQSHFANFFNNFTLAIPVPTSTDLAQASGGTTALAFATTSGMSAGQTMTGLDVPLGDTIASIVSTAQVTFATTGSSASGQTVISVTSSPAVAVGQQCVDTTTGHGAYIGAGNLIASVSPGTSVTLTSNIVTTIPLGDTIKCDPVVTLVTATSAAVPAATPMFPTTNHVGLSAASGFVEQGDASIFGNLNIGGTMNFSSSTTGASVQTFANSPCSTSLTTEQWIPVSITGQTGTWYVPACH